MSKGHKHHCHKNGKGDCKKDFCKQAKNDNAGKCPHPKTDACVPAPKKDDAGCCPPKKGGGCG